MEWPIKSIEDISRGGWIVAVGLRDGADDSQSPLRLYRPLHEPQQPGYWENGKLYRLAIRRCYDIVDQILTPLFPDDVCVRTGRQALIHIIDGQTGSGLVKVLHRTPLYSYWQPTTPHLNADQCAFVMEFFNSYRDLTPDEVTSMKPILLPIMDAVVRGALEVVQYLRHHSTQELVIPPELKDFDRLVYLRDCKTEIPMT